MLRLGSSVYPLKDTPGVANFHVYRLEYFINALKLFLFWSREIRVIRTSACWVSSESEEKHRSCFFVLSLVDEQFFERKESPGMTVTVSTIKAFLLGPF